MLVSFTTIYMMHETMKTKYTIPVCVSKLYDICIMTKLPNVAFLRMYPCC